MHFLRLQNSFCRSFPLSSLSFFYSVSASRIGSSYIYPYLINNVFNFTEESCSRCEGFRNERDSARRENQTLEKEIQVLKKKTENYQRVTQVLQKSLESVKEEQRNLQLLSENLEAAKKEQEEKMGQLKRKNEEPENKVTKKTSEFEKILASEQKLRKVLDCLEKSLADFKAKSVEL